MEWQKGESYIYLVVVVIAGAFLFGGGSRLIGDWSTTKFSGPEPTSTPAPILVTPTPGTVQLPGATPTPTPTP